MDRQKTIPPLSTKITRKLAQESADHNSLMNFYSQISRDETGAPKKWKMTSPLHIDEESITSGRVGKSSTSPRERSGRKSVKNSKKSDPRDSSSSDRSSSRESSLESKDKQKSEDRRFKRDARRSFSTGSARQTSDSLKDGKVVKKRGRPRSLDLSAKNVTNGDDDNFKSPVPLTPCNIAVKRKKGRPKETPPVLVAETPLDNKSVRSDSDTEEQFQPPKKKPGRKPKNLNLKSVPSFGLNRLDGHGLKKYGSKLVKTGFRPKFTKLTKMKSLQQTNDVTDSNGTSSSDDNGSLTANKLLQGDSSDKNSEEVTPKRKPGRPPGAKNKKYKNLTVALNARRRAAKLNSSKMLKGPKRRGPGRPKNKPKPSNFVQTDTSEEGYGVSSQGTETVTDYEMNASTTANGDVCYNAIDEAIDSVVFKARNNMVLETKRDPFKTNLFYKKRSAVKSIAKFKKERDALNKMRQKRLLAACGTNESDLLKDENLAQNDLRRKLQNKIKSRLVDNIESTSEVEVLLKKSEWVTYKSEESKPDGAMLLDGPLNSVSGGGPDNLKIQVNQPVSTAFVSCEVEGETDNPYDRFPKAETNMGFQLEADQVIKVKKVLGEMTKGSDTESVCSELSLNSLSSMKRPFFEKQILILGEDNTDSDEVTVRTRQRFEIIPGKKRKRTLSGEFDLLDEKQLRKEKKKAEKGHTDDESEKKPTETISTKKPLFKKRISPLKKSPTLKDGKIVRKYVNKLNSYTLYRNRLLKQSPFLNKGRRRRRKPLFHGKSTFISDTFGANTDMSSESSTKVKNSVLDKSKSESYRQGLFEKFTNNSLENKRELKENCMEDSVGNLSYEHGEENEEMTVEETVDDSDTIDFHSVDQIDNDDIELFTDSEIEVREILFGLIDYVVRKCEGDTNIFDVTESKLESIAKKAEHFQKRDETNPSNSSETSGKDGNLSKSAVNEIVGSAMPYKSEESTSMAGEVSVNDDHLKAEGKQKTFNRRKVKMRRGKKLGPLPIARRQNTLNPLSTVVRKKPGRKPGRPRVKKLENLTSTSEQPIFQNLDSGNIAWPVKRSRKATARKTSTSGSDSMGLIRTFELRQKISRSPLDNIALKQSIEENEYLKNEAQKASRKEAKLKSKLKLVQDINKDSFRSEMTFSDVNQQDTSEDDYILEECIGRSVEELLAFCKPCSVVLKDFIKELERAQTDVSCESETDVPRDSDEDIPNEIVETNESTVANSPSNDIGESTETKILSEMIPCSENKSDNVKLENEVKNSVLIDKTESCEKIIEHETLSETVSSKVNTKVEIKTEVKHKRKSPAKAKVSISPNKNVKISPQRRTKIDKPKHVYEQQTARKTVPPLKIKLKGGLSSRRKTYMVEPHPDSPIEQLDKSGNKPDKKKEKSKLKSGNKSESSDSEKLGKHHHHKKRNKTPTEEIHESGKIVAVEGPEKVIKPTDAYEANFLQFIQDKDKVEQNIAAFSHSFSTKTKSTIYVKNKEAEDKVMKGNAQKADVTTNKTDENMANIDKDTDMTDVQYVCSQCDNVVYRAKEQIIQHYNEVHPGLQFIYKPLSESSSSDDLRNMRMAGNAAINEQQAAQKVNEFAEINDNPASVDPITNNEGDDDDSGSLNLKITDVVSLKDQQNILPVELPISKPQRPVAPIGPLPIQPTELRIPTFPMFSTGGALQYSGLTLVSRPPQSYPMAAQLTPMAMVQPTIARQQQPIKPEPAILRHSPKQPGKLGNTFKCEKCNVHAPLLAAMVAHLRSVHKEIQRLFQCPYCKDLEAESEAMIHQHIKKTHPSNNPNPPVALSEPAKRNLKTLSVFVPESMKMGEGNSIDRDIYMCLRCKTHMPSLDTIYDHLEKEHSEIFAYVCPVCKVFKSHSEDSVNNHIITEHRQSPFDVSVSLAIEGTHFTRVQCLVKEKNKGGQKSSQKQVMPTTTIAPKHNPTSITQSINSMPENVVSAASTVLSIPLALPSYASHVQSQSLTATKSSVSQPVSKPATTQAQKKKKNLLESIEKLTVQKQMEQGIIPSKSSSVSLKVPSHPSQLTTAISSTAAPPPPLLRAPPPLIRYDQLNKVTSAQSTMLGSSVRTSSAHLGQGGIRSQLNLAMLQKLQALPNMSVPSPVQPSIPAKPIKSSLFDTSDLEPSVASQRPVLNVPVVPKLGNKSQSHQGQSLKTGGGAMPGAPLDLSKTTPSPSPDHLQSASPVPSQPRAQHNPDEFKVFNLKPSTQMQLPRTAVPLSVGPIMIPQQVRQNTPSTLAYRPPGPQINANMQQIQQLINVPMGTVIGLGPNMTPIFGAPNVSQGAQFLRMSAPQIAASGVTVLASTQVLNAGTQLNPVKNVVAGQQMFNRNTLFRCPYCPKLTPLRFDQVQSHIQTQHPPGSQILFMPFETK